MKRRRKNNRRDPLKRNVDLCLLWLVLQGLIYVLAFDSLALFLHLRWDANSTPLLKAQGVSLLAMAFFLSKALDKPRQQYLAVDSLLVLLLGQSVITLSALLQSAHSISDWFILTVNLGLSVSLLLHRVKAADQKPLPLKIPPTPAPLAVKTIPAHKNDIRSPEIKTTRILNSLAWLQSQAIGRTTPGLRPAMPPSHEVHWDLPTKKSSWTKQTLLTPPKPGKPTTQKQRGLYSPPAPQARNHSQTKALRPPPIPLPPQLTPDKKKSNAGALSEAIPTLR